MKNRILLLFLFLVFTFALIKMTKKGECQYLVVFKDHKNIMARTINSYNSGFVDIRDCGGKSIITSESYIDTIKILN